MIMEKEKKQRLGTGRVAFLARKEEIKARIEAGYTMITVYEEHQKQLGISYGQFVNYVNRYIKKKGNEPAVEAPKKDESAVEGKKKGSTLDSLKAQINQEDII